MLLSSLVEGDGPTVLWLHGYTMDSTTWRELWSLLPGWRHVGIDLPGHGRSAPLEPGVTLPDVAAAVADKAKEYGAIRLVALSFGTMVALQLAMDEPGVIERLVLAAPAMAGRGTEPGADVRYREVMKAYQEEGRGSRLVDTWMQSPPDIFRGTERLPVLRFRLRQVILRHRWTELETGAMAALATYPQPDERLPAVSAALRVLVGEHDMPLTREVSHRLAAAVPGARLDILEGAGHLCLLEAPSRAASLIHEHLAAS